MESSQLITILLRIEALLTEILEELKHKPGKQPTQNEPRVMPIVRRYDDE